jgi:superfamily I DNA and RNA helicase
MELNPQTLRRANSDPAAQTLLKFAETNSRALGLERAAVYYRFPIYKEEESIVTTDVLIISPRHGVLAFGLCNATRTDVREQIEKCDDRLDQIFNHLFSRLVRYRSLRESKKELSFPLEAAIFAPSANGISESIVEGTSVSIIENEAQLKDFFDEHRVSDPLSDIVLSELIAVIEGSKALPRPKERKLEQRHVNSKVAQIARLEAEINRFDKDQKGGFLAVIDGFQRIRGLAGSGKTVVLAMKAALTHLNEPDARIAFTFHTKSLYQHVRRLITRFYRQFDDRDPNWDKLTILHAWGGRSIPGIYSTACLAHGVRPLTYDQAQMLSSKPVFEFVCEDLLEKVKIKPVFDYVFVDEGQDFPGSFLRLAIALAHKQRMVLAYDELQTIFQPQAPSMSEVFGVDKDGNPNVELEEDVVLHKCYRNPLEVLVCAHAMGFGIYGKKIVQMLENREHWFDLGYEVENEDLRAGELTRIRRPRENSPSSISDSSSANEIVVGNVFRDFSSEINAVVKAIKHDIEVDGLEPDDILVISADDRHAKQYLGGIAKALQQANVNANNMHEDTYNIRDFAETGAVTLATIHKAKGNEAYMVYVVGIDGLFGPGVRARNMMFSALTRTKAWLRVSGIGAPAQAFVEELNVAKSKLPYLEFTYPSEVDITTMKRDLQETPEQRVGRALEELEADLPVEELAQALEQKLRALRGNQRRSSKKWKMPKKQ